MKFATVLSRLKRIKKLGVTGLIGALRRRGRTALWRLLKKKSALNGSAHHTWESIAEQLPATQQSFAQFWKNNPLLPPTPYVATADKQANLAREAANAATQKFSVLGSALVHFPDEINWHRDFKLDAPPPVFTAVDQTLRYERHQFDFHLDIPMHKPPRTDANTYYEDVKTIWDFSRLHHLVALAGAGEHEALEVQMASWLDANPYLLGINWKCPMDVAIRAINIIWTVGLLRTAQHSLPLPLAERITCSLYDHMQYLAWNWEESDKPNNHYLADLVGYFYLCAFFSAIPHFAKKMRWALKKIERAFAQQLLPDGTAYESSTAYHRLDTELLQHVKIVCEAMGESASAQNSNHSSLFSRIKAFITPSALVLSLSKDTHAADRDSTNAHVSFETQPTAAPQDERKSQGSRRYNLKFPAVLQNHLTVMEQFLRDCTDHNGNLVKIGDDDSGKIVFGPTIPEQATAQGSRHYPNFGLYILRNDHVHMTLREASLASHQPSGHAHHDELALTLSIDGQPVIVDGGSFIYTGNPAWRNRMRGLGQHSTFYPDWWQEQTDHAMARGDLFQNEGRILTRTYPSRRGNAAASGRAQAVDRADEKKISPLTTMERECHCPHFCARPEEVNGRLEGNARSHPDQICTTSSYHLPHGQTTLSRSVRLEQAQLIISDELTSPVPTPVTWQLILHPKITVKMTTENSYQLLLDGSLLATLHCSVPLLATHDAFFAPEYGEIMPTTRLSWHGEMEKVETVITLTPGVDC